MAYLTTVISCTNTLTTVPQALSTSILSLCAAHDIRFVPTALLSRAEPLRRWANFLRVAFLLLLLTCVSTWMLKPLIGSKYVLGTIATATATTTNIYIVQ